MFVLNRKKFAHFALTRDGERVMSTQRFYITKICHPFFELPDGPAFQILPASALNLRPMPL
jgi:hypothetical protein